MLVEGIVGLQSDNEYVRNNFIVAVLKHSHLVLKITDVAFESLSWLHLNGEDVIVVLLKLLSQGVLVEEDIANLFEAPERSR